MKHKHLVIVCAVLITAWCVVGLTYGHHTSMTNDSVRTSHPEGTLSGKAIHHDVTRARALKDDNETLSASFTAEHAIGLSQLTQATGTPGQRYKRDYLEGERRQHSRLGNADLYIWDRPGRRGGIYNAG